MRTTFVALALLAAILGCNATSFKAADTITITPTAAEIDLKGVVSGPSDMVILVGTNGTGTDLVQAFSLGTYDDGKLSVLKSWTVSTTDFSCSPSYGFLSSEKSYYVVLSCVITTPATTAGADAEATTTNAILMMSFDNKGDALKSYTYTAKSNSTTPLARVGYGSETIIVATAMGSTNQALAVFGSDFTLKAQLELTPPAAQTADEAATASTVTPTFMAFGFNGTNFVGYGTYVASGSNTTNADNLVVATLNATTGAIVNQTIVPIAQTNSPTFSVSEKYVQFCTSVANGNDKSTNTSYILPSDLSSIKAIANADGDGSTFSCFAYEDGFAAYQNQVPFTLDLIETGSTIKSTYTAKAVDKDYVISPQSLATSGYNSDDATGIMDYVKLTGATSSVTGIFTIEVGSGSSGFEAAKTKTAYTAVADVKVATATLVYATLEADKQTLEGADSITTANNPTKALEATYKTEKVNVETGGSASALFVSFFAIVAALFF